jgi:HAD superfamily hydrolase (TIGR01509 family)
VSQTTSPLGIIFDWDGVIIDSSQQHEESWERLAEEEGKVLPSDHFTVGFGRKNEWIIPMLLKWTEDTDEIHQLSLRKEALYREVVMEKGLVALPGVAEFLQRLKAAGIPSCVGSSTHRANIDTIMGVLGFEGLFGGNVTAEDVSQGKPDPEVFLKAATKTGCSPQHCIVFEDAMAGIEAARAGGMKVVGVSTTHPANELTMTDRVVHRLDELEIDDLRNLID